MHTGLDRIASNPSLAKRYGVFGLLAHPASVTRDLVHVSEVFEKQRVRPKVIFGPEHGYGGEAQDMVGVDDAKDTRGIPVRSLYGERFSDLIPRDEDIHGLDTLIIDLQDIGSRYYTFIWTAVLAMRACVRKGVRVVVLDRPNPIGSDFSKLEGRCQEPKYRSFVGLEGIPVRHGLTLGEIVSWRAAVEGVPKEQVEIVRTEGILRDADATSWDRPFVMPSPNMPTFETALVYPGGCLVEGTNLSEGRGTTRPFELIGASWLDGTKLARELSMIQLPGFIARPTTFRPTFHKYAGETCGGVQIHVVDSTKFRPMATYLALIALAQRQNRESFRFRTEAYEFIDDIPAFDLLTGSPAARTMMNDGERIEDILESIATVTRTEIEVVDFARHSLS